MKKLFTTCLILSICLVWACETPWFAERVFSIKVQNNSDQDVIFLFSYLYPDTLIPDQYNAITSVPVDGFAYKDYRRHQWKNLFNDLPRDTLSLFIFSRDTLVKYGWQTLRNDYKILKRYEISKQDLESWSNSIVYP